MNCVICGGDSCVIDTAKQTDKIKRRRKCKVCNSRWTTIEKISYKESSVKTKKTVQAHVDNIEFGYWDMKTQTFMPVDVTLQGNVDAAAKAIKCSELLIDTLGLLTRSIKEQISQDLKDIWRRLDEAGI
jgi:transcriptional regulator NrdR family protein